MKISSAILVPIFASSTLAATPQAIRRDGEDYGLDDGSSCIAGVVGTIYTTVTVTVEPDETAAGTAWAGAVTGSSEQDGGNGVGGDAYTYGTYTTAGAVSGSYDDDGGASAQGSGYGSAGWDAGSGSNIGQDYGSGFGTGVAQGGQPSGTSGDNSLKVLATYGPWVIVPGGALDLTPGGSGAYQAPGVNPPDGPGAGSDNSIYRQSSAKPLFSTKSANGAAPIASNAGGYDNGAWGASGVLSGSKASLSTKSKSGAAPTASSVGDYDNDGWGASNVYSRSAVPLGNSTASFTRPSMSASTAVRSFASHSGSVRSSSSARVSTGSVRSSTSGKCHHISQVDYHLLTNLTASRTSSSAQPSQSGCTPCGGNTASTRGQWCKYDLQTDYYNITPCTGKTREYFFEISEHMASPDGYPRLVQSINGQIPGPTIEGDWGDEFVIHFTNNLSPETHNGTSLHFHGVQQLNTNSNDGANSITQCPIAPGDTYTYRWRATAYGSSWYHSHFGFQAWNGAAGAIVVHGPASANYDVDIGPVLMTDWNHWTSDMLYPLVGTVGVFDELTGLINGKNTWNTSISSDPTSPAVPVVPAVPASNSSSTTGSIIGEYYSIKFEAGLSYRLRLVNTAIESGFRFSIDNHIMTVIANDFVPITPYQTDTIFLNMGQRYDVIVKADQTSSKDFWMRAIPQAACSTNTNQLGIKGIVHYADSTATPTTDSNDYTDACVDEPMASLIPALAKNAGAADIQSTQAVTLAKDVNNYFFWQLDGAEFIVKWDDPMLLDVHNNDTTSLKAQPHVIELPTRDEWFYLLITETGLPITHPIHLHGHDFFVVGQGTAAYTGSEPIQAINPPRRDVATLPAGGWLMLAWKADNPGAWLAHCHIGWHTLQGFALQFLELEDEINSTPGVVDTDQLPATCNKWNTYAASFDAIQGGDGSFDSGL